MITNPEYLSKDRLKNELKSHGIKYNQNEKKDYYIMLYRKHVMEVDEPRHEFSSDEEFTQRNKRPEKKQHSPKKKGKTVKLDAYLADVQNLDDEELKEELERYGKDIGPITETTRALYQKMLAKCMAENVTGKSVPSRSVKPQEPSNKDDGVPADSFVGEWSSDDSETEEVVIQAGRQPPPPPKMGMGARDDLRDRSKRPPVEEPVEVPQDSRRSRPKKRSSSSSSSKGSSFYSFLVLLIMFAVAFFSYEHYTSTEDDPSLITKGWRKSACLWKDLQGYIVKSSPAPAPTNQPTSDSASTQADPPATTPPSAKTKTPPTKEKGKSAPKAKATSSGKKTSKNTKAKGSN